MTLDYVATGIGASLESLKGVIRSICTDFSDSIFFKVDRQKQGKMTYYTCKRQEPLPHSLEEMAEIQQGLDVKVEVVKSF